MKERKRLVCQANGWIVVKTVKPGLVSIATARDLKYRIELRTNRGWRAQDEFDDDTRARREYAGRNKFFDYRLVAVHEIGTVRLPDSWKGPE
jgi:hypothetical protein